MKKIFIGVFITLFSITSVLAYTPSIEIKKKLDIISEKIDIIIDSRGESYRDKFLTIINNYKVKYEANEKAIYILTYISDHLNKNNTPPNILLIIADDMGLDASPWYNDYKGQKPKTPTLDELANNGLIFDNVWANPLCSPTRATILTGKYGIHTGVLGALSKNDDGVSISEYSIQKMITEKSKAGYDQAVIGKWHLATDNNGADDNPELMGVPYYAGYIGGAMQDYSKWKKTTSGVTEISNTYATTEFTNDSISWVNNIEDKPWFLWLAYTAPHSPFHLPPTELLSDETKNNLSGTESDIEENPLPYYLAMIEAMDSEIGRFLDSLSESERENTVIIFIGDNGTPAQVTQTPFIRGESKGSISRGGVHVPMFVSGKGINSGRAEEFVNTSDLYTTIAELTGIILPTYGNSISFAPVLFGKNREVSRDYLYAEISSPNKRGGPSAKNGWTIRKDGYQFISLDNGTEKLFADSDLGQTNDLINNLTDIASQLRELGISVRGGETKGEYGQYPTNTDDIVCHDFTNTLGEYEAISDSKESTNSLTYKIVDTGVIDSYSDTSVISAPASGQDFYGQDSQYQINTPSYTNNKNATITDNVTGLMWEQDMGNKMTYEEAFKKAKDLNLGGHNDWRVPNIKELYSLIQFTGKVGGEKAIEMFIDKDYFNQPLGDTSNDEREIDAQTWSSTQYVGKTMNSDETVFGVNFVDGRIKGYPKYNPKTKSSNSMYFRLVRGNTSYGVNNFSDNANETITDNATGLMWNKNDSKKGLDWEESLEYCEDLILSSYSDWRLPNTKELQSIVDYTRSPQTTNSPAINSMFNTTSINAPDGDKNYPFFWTSTTHLDGKNPEAGGVYIAFGEAQGEMRGTLMDVHGAGAQRSDPKSGNTSNYPTYFGPQGDIRYVYNYARCVRNTDEIVNNVTETTNTNSSSTESTTSTSSSSEVSADITVSGPNAHILVCENKNIGETCSFESPRDTITGTCKQMGGNKACVPN